jgi:zinc transport system ATP-binding protein
MSAAARTDNEPVVILENLTVDYPNGVEALDHVSLKIFQGDLVGLIGPNGAGKSTLLNVILGLQRPTSGTVKLFGDPVSSASLRYVGYVPQGAQATDPNFPSTVLETVMLGRIPRAGLFKRLGRDDVDKVEKTLELMGIQDLKGRRIGQLSGGQSQRVFVAKAIASDPKLLILDEPTSGVDLHSKNEFYSSLEKLNRELGITIILSSHDIGTVTRLATRVVCLNRSVFFCGPTQEFESSKALAKAYDYPVELMHHTDHP